MACTNKQESTIRELKYVNCLYMVLCDIADLEQWGLYQHRAQGNCKFKERKDLNCNVLQPQIRGKDWTSD